MAFITTVVNILKLIIFPGFIFTIFLSLFYEWIDRKFYAKLQNRVGPLYTGPSGLLQPLADFIKLLSKEDITPEAVDKLFFTSAPILALSLMLTGVFLLPIATTSGIISFNGDVIVAVAIMTIFCILVFLSGLGSLNRFGFVGAERAVSQLLGYEIPMTLAIASVALASNSLKISEVIAKQSSWWFILGPQAIGFAIFLIAAQAELERVPFDIPEAEQEIVAGWLTEFSGRKLALFRLARNVELVYVSGLAATFYLGGPLGPVTPGFEAVLFPVYFIIKTIIVLLIISVIRAAFARLRIDQMVNFSWKYLVPISLLQLLLVRVVI
ncbi:NADH-quinone oxidoreductase subunit H [Candidatus Bathyarchaeota archaeon]|nr:NADH-quinone oxidoreductase subunit H [Candidatus Bathyarchaeota archaeon]